MCSRDLQPLFTTKIATTSKVTILESRVVEAGMGSILYCSSFATRWGCVVAAATEKGLARAAFVEDIQQGVQDLKLVYPCSSIVESALPIHSITEQFFATPDDPSVNIVLDLQGTPFQMNVWRELLSVELGRVTTYGAIATILGMPTGSRAVGGAVGANPVAFIIPCHRVVQQNGKLGNYMWGIERKAEILRWEQRAF